MHAVTPNTATVNVKTCQHDGAEYDVNINK